MLVVFGREWTEYFKTLLGYVFIAAFMFLAGVFFVSDNIRPLDADFNTTLNDCIYVFMLTAPLLTMRLLSEEKKTKRDQLLLTSSVSLTSIVTGKFLSAVAVFAITCAITFTYPVILFVLGSPSLPLILNGYLGFFLIGVAFISVGVFISAFTENQLTAAVGTYGCLLLFLTLDLIISQIRVPWLATVLEWFSLFKRFQPFQFGSFSVSSTVYYIVFIAVFVILAILVMEKRRWKR
jgi:ABC-2 type transport system permease protein